ncbi:hypothetical protein FRC02_002258 [Tulasnella sp. 418]|nr:hypothetical protein FRC02_002258 [Tulasnella sp. 418]
MLVLPAFIGISLLTSVAGLPRADRDVPPPTRQLARRDLASDFANIVGQIPEDVFGHLMPGSMKIPSEDQVKNDLGLNDSYIASLPTQILNIPGYANWTGQNWNVRLHGATYVQPAPSNETLDDLAEDFLPDIEQSQYNQTMRDQSRNLTGALYALPRKEVPLAFNVVYNEQQIANILYPYPSDDHGEFEGFVPIQTTAIPSGEGRKGVQAAVVYAQGGQNGNSSTYFVSQNGVTIIADIDDILRETKIYVPKLGLENSFAYKFRIWDGMNELLHQWQRDDLSMHFHYLTTTPEQATSQCYHISIS